jgi:hypothetical protein
LPCCSRAVAASTAVLMPPPSCRRCHP